MNNQWWQEHEQTPAESTPESLPYMDITPRRYGDNDEISANEDRPARRSRPLRRRVGDPLLVLAAVGTFFAVTRLAEDPASLGSDGAAAAPVASASAASKLPMAGPLEPALNARRTVTSAPRFVVPVTARPGEQITIVAYRDAGLCGPTSLRLDGTPLSHQLLASVTPAAGDWVDVYLTLTIPPATSVGRHGLELFGPVAGGETGATCGDEPEHEDRVTGVEIIVVP